MVKQISLDSWQVQRLAELLQKGSGVVKQTKEPIILYRQTLEEDDGSYEEIVCTLTDGYVIEQLVTSGGVMPPTFHEQWVFAIEEYPARLIRKSRDRFSEIVAFLENKLE